MKFGKQLETYKIPEWFEYYLDYNGIKTVLKFIDIRPSKRKKLKILKMKKAKYEKKYKTRGTNDPSRRRISIISSESSSLIVTNPHKIRKFKNKKKRIIEAEDLSLLPDEEKISKFISIYRNKIKLVDEFFTYKLQEFSGELNKIEYKMNFIDNSSSEHSHGPEMKSKTDELGYAVSWKRALSTIYNETSWLHSYHSINSLAVLKIKKKAIKIFKLNNIEIKEPLEKISTEFNFFSNSLNKLVDLRVRIKKLYSLRFSDGDEKKANNELENRLLGETKKKKPRLICLYLGLLIAFIFCYIIFKVIDGKNTSDSFKPFFPFFYFSYIIILVLALVGIDMTILQHYRINYVYLLDLSPKNNINPEQIFQTVIGLSALWMFLFLMMKLTLKFCLFGGEYTLFPLLMNLSLIILLFLPFHIIQPNFRRGLIKVMIKMVFPVGSNAVRFKQSLLGDVLISLSDPFKNIILGYCLMVCKECYLTNTRGPCNKETYPCWIISAYPQFIRFTQNVNRLYYTRLYWPYLGNTIKYFTRFWNTTIGFFYEKKKGKIRFILRIFIGAFSSCYNIFWDIYVDWGCLRKNNNYFLLREKITFHPLVYYFAMIYDIILRGAWTWYFIPTKSSLSEWKSLFKDTLEICRRGLWALIRVENESLNNPESYRSFLIIPELAIDD